MSANISFSLKELECLADALACLRHDEDEMRRTLSLDAMLSSQRKDEYDDDNRRGAYSTSALV